MNTINNITYSNIDIVQCIQLAAFYPTQGANLDTITMDSIRVDSVTDRILEFQIEIPNWESWNGRLGYIHNVKVNNVSVDSFGRRNSIFLGYDPTRDISNVNFTNYSVGGSAIGSMSAAHIDTTSYVSNVTFSTNSASTSTAPPPATTQPPASSPVTNPPTSSSPSTPSSPTAGPIADGVYLITNRSSGLVLDNPNFSTTSGQQMIQWSLNNGSNQKWKFTATSDGLYTIQNMSSSMVLGDGGGTLRQYWKNGQTSQLWSVASAGSGSYVFTNKSTGKVMDDPNFNRQQGTGLITWPANGGSNQAWSIASAK
jgi:hypothetical protein